MAERHAVPPRFWTQESPDEIFRKISQTVQGLLKGLSNNWRKVELVEDETVTEIGVEYAMSGMVALFSPQDATTAAEIAAGTIWATVEEGKVVIHHGAASGTRTLGVCLLG